MRQSWRDDLRAMLTLAGPVIAGQVGMVAMGTVDIAMLGRVSAQALAAGTLGNVYAFGLLVAAMGTLYALDPVVAQAVGAGERGSVAANVQRGCLLAAVFSVPIVLLMLPAQPVMEWLRQPADVIPDAAGYVHASIAGVLPFLLFVVFRQTLQAFSRTRPIVLAVIVANLANAGLDWLLIFGGLGLPPMGAIGSAWATSACRLLLATLLLVLGHAELKPLLRPWQPRALRLRPMARLLRLGTPIGLAHVLEYGAFLTTAVLIGTLGEDQLAGHNVAINMAALTFMVPLGVSSAAAVRVGYAVGRRDHAAAVRAASTALVTGASVMAAFMVLFGLAPHALARCYTDRPGILAVAVTLVPLAGAFQVFDGVQVVAAGVLRGLGDTRTPMLVHLFGFWVVGVPLGCVLGFTAELGPRGLWWGLVAGLGAAASALLVRVRVLSRRDVQPVSVEDVG